MSERVVVSVDGHVAEVLLNRPDKHNALDMEMFAEIAKVGMDLAEQPGLRAVVLSGAGENFCAGIDLGFFKDGEISVDPATMVASGHSFRISARSSTFAGTMARLSSGPVMTRRPSSSALRRLAISSRSVVRKSLAGVP